MCMRGRRRKAQRNLVIFSLSIVLALSQGLWVKTRGATSAKTSAWKAPSLVPNYHALVIGINEYKQSRDAVSWTSLRTARPDAEAMADVLEQEYGFKVTRLFDERATRRAIITALDQTTKLTENDALLVYYAGHGHYESKLDEGYWIPSDAARQVGGQVAKDGWIWNSVTTKILSASPARHILVVADSCYSGSLFRGDSNVVSPRQQLWYRRAIAKPSRYLITSSNYDEPSPDSGIEHSDFAMHLLNYLRYTDTDVFSASDLGVAVRDKISMKSGNLVRMGPLPDVRHADGEFVFLKRGAKLLEPAGTQVESPGQQQRGRSSEPTSAPLQQTLQDALIAKERGATNTAHQLVKNLAVDNDQDPMLETVKTYVHHDSSFTSLGELQNLLDELAKRDEKKSEMYEDSAVPRIIACIGPQVYAGDADSESLSMLYRICLQAELKRRSGIRVVVRETLDAFLRERQLASTSFSDEQVRQAFGKLLPAGMLLLGELFPNPDGHVVMMRLADAGSTELLGVCTVEVDASGKESVYHVCQKLADQVVGLAKDVRPLHTRVLGQRDGLLEASVGRFHAASLEMVFDVLQRVPLGADSSTTYRVRDVGDAHIVRLGESSSDLTPQWQEDSATLDPGSLWIREK